ncbi:MAG: leucine-rich repeat protein [Spirochaetales bacterium]|nr:leucine-rich repeat protein [Spirochaetales bacterium]
MLKKLLSAALIALAILFCFISCDDSSSSKKPSFDAKSTPLTLENYDNQEIEVQITIIRYQNDEINLYYSIDGGEKIEVTRGNPIKLGVGQKVSLYGDRKENTGSQNKYIILDSTGDCYVYGNVMSLITPTGFETNTSLKNHDYAFYSLFKECRRIKPHEEKDLVLPATTLSGHCYEEMFYDWQHISKAPELPALELAEACYARMFFACTNLTEAPTLPAMKLAELCYFYMFNECVNLKGAPKLPATELADNCYISMFANCHSLTESPELPAKQLTNRCYEGMFQNCKNLTTSPTLPAPTLVYSCYRSMFKGCSKLSSVTCLATTDETTDATNGWTNGVATDGKFIKTAGATFWKTGINGIPSGWERVDAE